MQAETGLMQPQDKGGQEPPETGRGNKGLSSRAPQEAQACQNLDSRLLASSTVRKETSIV